VNAFSLNQGIARLELPVPLLDDYITTIERINNFFQDRDKDVGEPSHTLERCLEPSALDLHFNLEDIGVEVHFMGEQLQTRWRSRSRNIGHRVLSSTNLVQLGAFYTNEWQRAAFLYSKFKRILDNVGIPYSVQETAKDSVRLVFQDASTANSTMLLYHAGYFNGN